MELKEVACGGTFDHFHAGHKKLIDECFKHGQSVIVGVTDGAMVRHKPYAATIESYDTRRANLMAFAKKYPKPFKVVRLTDIYGPTIKNNEIGALFVTQDTVSGAEAIQKKRKEAGMKPLSVHIVPFVYDDGGEKISSERIRAGVVSREGKNYHSFLVSREVFVLPESLRRELRHPLGSVFFDAQTAESQILPLNLKTATKNGVTAHISVGDVVTGILQKSGITPYLTVIDGKTQRKALNDEELALIKNKDCHNALNASGTIGRGAVRMLYALLHSGQQRATKQLFIEGEEDLLTLPVILLAPLSASVWYGLRNKGAVRVNVTEKKKEKVYNLLTRFT